MIRGRMATHCDATIALAIELHAAGCSWRFIGYGLGRGIREAVHYAKSHGARKR